MDMLKINFDACSIAELDEFINKAQTTKEKLKKREWDNLCSQLHEILNTMSEKFPYEILFKDDDDNEYFARDVINLCRKYAF